MCSSNPCDSLYVQAFFGLLAVFFFKFSCTYPSPWEGMYFPLNADPACLIRLARCGNHPDTVLMGCDRTHSFSRPGRKNVDEGSLMSFHPHFNYANKLPMEALFAVLYSGKF